MKLVKLTKVREEKGKLHSRLQFLWCPFPLHTENALGGKLNQLVFQGRGRVGVNGFGQMDEPGKCYGWTWGHGNG